MKKFRTTLNILCFAVVLFGVITDLGRGETEKPAVLEAGAAVVDITGKDATVLDPLHVKAVVFRQGKEQAAIVECDVTKLSEEVANNARKQACEKTGIPVSNICVAATHTHMSEPNENLENSIVKAIVDAHVSAKPVRIQSGIGQEYTVSFNRRYYMKDGTVAFNPMFLNPDIVRPAGPIDPEINIVMLEGATDGKAVAVLTNFALHCDTVKEYGALYQKTGTGSRNTVSADYPYWLEQSLREKLGNDLVSLFMTGCCGNINHWDFSKPGPQSGHKTKTKEIGEKLGAAVKAELPKLHEEKASLKVLSRIVQVPLQSYSPEDLAWAKQTENTTLTGHSEEMSERKSFLDKIKKVRILSLEKLRKNGETWPLDVQVIRLSENTAIVTLPGEMFVEHGLTIKNLSPFENTMVVELANHSCSYVPNRKAFRQGSYEVENSRLAPGGGEMMVEAAIQMLKELKANN